MKTICMLVVAGALMISVKAGANSVYISGITGYRQSGFDGGEFNMSPTVGNSAAYASSAIVSGGNETFCVETGLGIAVPGTYTVTSISQSDSQGTALTEGAAWLYMEFAEGILADYDYSTSVANGSFANRAAAAVDLQEALWELQGQSYDASLANFYINIVSAAIGAGNLYLANNGLDNVAIVNLTLPGYGPVQNMLALVPDGGATAILLGLGLGGVRLFSRKMRRI